MPNDSVVSWGILLIATYFFLIRGAIIVIRAHEERYGGNKDVDVW